jgi:hypothetical protein
MLPYPFGSKLHHHQLKHLADHSACGIGMTGGTGEERAARAQGQ